MNKKYSLLIVDDDKFLLDLYRKKFEQSGLAVDVSVGSEDALQKLRGGASPDIMIFDMIMPGMDGLELLQTIRKENLSPKSIAIMLTNENESAKIDQAKALGVAGYLVKAMSVPSEIVEQVIAIADAKIT